MARVPKPLFLARSSYRQRRLADAARALPVFAALALVVPLLWPAAPGGLAVDLGYLLALWLGMILVAALLSAALALGEDEGAAPDARLKPSETRQPEQAPTDGGAG